MPRRERDGAAAAPTTEATQADAEERIKTYPSVEAGARNGLIEIARLDPAFDPDTFIRGAKQAYEMIVTAFAEGNRKLLKDLLSRDVYEGFTGAITDRESREEQVDQSFVGIDKADILDSEVKSGIASITVRFVSQLISATRDKAGADHQRRSAAHQGSDGHLDVQPRYLVGEGARQSELAPHRDAVAGLRRYVTLAGDDQAARTAAGWQVTRGQARDHGCSRPSCCAIDGDGMRRCRHTGLAHTGFNGAVAAPAESSRLPPRPNPAAPPMTKDDKSKTPEAQVKPAQPAAKQPDAKLERVTFADLPGWERDDHLAAFKTFLKSCDAVGKAAAKPPTNKAAPQCKVPAGNLAAICHAAQDIQSPTEASAKAFFETQFVPHRIVQQKSMGLLTGYYEPVMEGSRTAQGKFQTPVYKRPTDLVNVVDEADRASKPEGLTHVRQTAAACRPIRRAPRSTRAHWPARGWSCSTWKTRWRCSSCTSRARGASISPTAPRCASTTTARTATRTSRSAAT